MVSDLTELPAHLANEPPLALVLGLVEVFKGLVKDFFFLLKVFFSLCKVNVYETYVWYGINKLALQPGCFS